TSRGQGAPPGQKRGREAISTICRPHKTKTTPDPFFFFGLPRNCLAGVGWRRKPTLPGRVLSCSSDGRGQCLGCCSWPEPVACHWPSHSARSVRRTRSKSSQG